VLILLDLRIAGRSADHLVCDIVDVRDTYANDNLAPDFEYVAIAVLALEGVVPKMASANWDGLVEKAVASTTHGDQNIVAILVRADDTPGANGRTHLHKFHGCLVRASFRSVEAGRPISGRDCATRSIFARGHCKLDRPRPVRTRAADANAAPGADGLCAVHHFSRKKNCAPPATIFVPIALRAVSALGSEL
jgi:hypothetical protein